METQITLTILGRPLTFSSSVEACKTIKVGNRFKPGPCPKNPGKGETGKTKALPKKATKPPGLLPDEERKAAEEKRVRRDAEIEKIMNKPDHFGLPSSQIPKALTDVALFPGWETPLLRSMSIQYRGKHGYGSISLHPQGWQAIAPGNPDTNLPPLHQVFRDITQARIAVQQNAGPRRMRPPRSGIPIGF